MLLWIAAAICGLAGPIYLCWRLWRNGLLGKTLWPDLSGIDAKSRGRAGTVLLATLVLDVPLLSVALIGGVALMANDQPLGLVLLLLFGLPSGWALLFAIRAWLYSRRAEYHNVTERQT